MTADAVLLIFATETSAHTSHASNRATTSPVATFPDLRSTQPRSIVLSSGSDFVNMEQNEEGREIDQDRRVKVGKYVGKRDISPQHDGDSSEAAEMSHRETMSSYNTCLA